MDPYNHKQVESKWQKRWEEEQAFATPELKSGDEKAYILDFFPYPSGYGLHVGHLLGYTGTDVISRIARMQGKKVLHTMGWDAFGLPAENFAIKSGVHPTVSTAKNVLEYKRQFRQTGISYDWTKEINASDPEYYKWTQWLFTVLYKRGLAYRKKGLVNWCPSCQTVLANEQVVNGLCDRCGSKVIQKELRQWYFKITEYAERLLSDLEELDWPEKIKIMQRNWIGKSEGALVNFAVQDKEELIEVFTTRVDTIFGATFLVLSPEHPLVESLTTPEQKEQVKQYQKEAAEKTELERTFLEKEKTGVFTGSYAINPAANSPIPIWIADYVIASYGTGVVMAVPAHDERDFAFAHTFSLPIVSVLETDGVPLPFNGKSAISVEGPYKGRKLEEVIDDLLKDIGGKKQITYRLRDWLVSRQRFWGAPIPIVYDSAGQEHILPLESLPVELPMDVEFLPTGQSPLVLANEWKTYTDPKTGEMMTREVDTLDTFVCSSWYYLRFPTPHNAEAAFSPELVKQWLPVDTYVGGAEHAVLHLLYARFFTKVLFDEGLVEFKEPFRKLRNQGMILGPDHRKMSKSKGNVINPDEVIAEYGADTLRVYELFMGPFELEKPWSTTSILGVYRFLERVWKLHEKVENRPALEPELRTLHKTIEKVSLDTANFKFNTAISTMMEALNQFSTMQSTAKIVYEQFITLLNPYAPHITEELWQLLGNKSFLSLSAWPVASAEYLVENFVEYPVQINGKVRIKLVIPAGHSEAQVLETVKADAKVLEWLKTGQLEKEIVIPGRLVSLVLKKVEKKG